MVGLGESEEEICRRLDDLYETGCKILTIGQYLQPGLEYMELVEYISPEKFEEYRIEALKLAFLSLKAVLLYVLLFMQKIM